MNRIIVRVVIISVAAALFLFILLINRSPFGKSNSSFASTPKEEITKIEFSQDRQKLSLEKAGANWLLNGKIETRKSGIQFILRILQEIKIKSPVSAELFEGEITMKNIVPVRVKVYEKRKLLKSFLVYKTQTNNYGNIMKIRERSKPFIVYIPGYEGDIGSGFTLNELFWQPFTVFNLMPSDIVSVELENFTDTASSFSISKKNNQFVLSDNGRELKGWDSTFVKRYISYFTWAPFESWAFNIDSPEKKAIETQKPLYRITVGTTLEKKIILTLWERISNENGIKTVDSDRLFGKTQNTDELFIIRYFDIDPLLKKRSYFFME